MPHADPDLNSPLIHSPLGGPDKGIGYQSSTNAIQNVLEKLRKQAGIKMKPDVPYRMKYPPMLQKMYKQLSSDLDDLIEFGRFSAVKRLPYTLGIIQAGPGEIVRSKSIGIKPTKSVGTSPLGLAVRKQRNIMQQRYNLDKHVEDIASGISKFRFYQMLDDLIQFQGDPRPRNNLGMFTDQNPEGPNPNSMYKTYIIAPQTPGMSPNKNSGALGALGAGGLAVAGGAGGALGASAAKSAIEHISNALKKSRIRR